MEGSNITLEWRYNFGGGSFRQLLFGNSDIHGIVDKMFLDKVPYMAPAYRGRLAANVTDTYTSITFLRVNRTDSTIYTLTITSFTKETASSKVEITVKCKYEKVNEKIFIVFVVMLINLAPRGRDFFVQHQEWEPRQNRKVSQLSKHDQESIRPRPFGLSQIDFWICAEYLFHHCTLSGYFQREHNRECSVLLLNN